MQLSFDHPDPSRWVLEVALEDLFGAIAEKDEWIAPELDLLHYVHGERVIRALRTAVAPEALRALSDYLRRVVAGSRGDALERARPGVTAAWSALADLLDMRIEALAEDPVERVRSKRYIAEILLHLRHGRWVPPSSVAQALRLNEATIRRALVLMEAANLVERRERDRIDEVRSV